VTSALPLPAAVAGSVFGSSATFDLLRVKTTTATTATAATTIAPITFDACDFAGTEDVADAPLAADSVVGAECAAYAAAGAGTFGDEPVSAPSAIASSAPDENRSAGSFAKQRKIS
jgi:hypothetical protein